MRFTGESIPQMRGIYVMLPETRAGDVIAVLTTGAYAYSMSSQYNRYPRPAMVAVAGGAAQVIVERETYADVARMDR
jgi:diaminopimelate decarboxylase